MAVPLGSRLRKYWPFGAGRLPIGRRGEIDGAFYLRKHGYRLIACPYVARDGEIDIVADHAGCLVFVEVKTRRGDPHPEDAVTGPKRVRIERAAREFRRRYRPTGPYRFDILAVTVSARGRMRFHLIPDAFRVAEDGFRSPADPDRAT